MIDWRLSLFCLRAHARTRARTRAQTRNHARPPARARARKHAHKHARVLSGPRIETVSFFTTPRTLSPAHLAGNLILEHKSVFGWEKTLNLGTSDLWPVEVLKATKVIPLGSQDSVDAVAKDARGDAVARGFSSGHSGLFGGVNGAPTPSGSRTGSRAGMAESSLKTHCQHERIARFGEKTAKFIDTHHIC